MSNKQRRAKVVKKTVAATKVRLIQGEVFQFDPNKRYLVLLRTGSIDQERLKSISQRLQKEFGDVFTLALPEDTEMSVVETDAPASPPTPPDIKEGDTVGLKGFGKADGDYKATDVKPDGQGGGKMSLEKKDEGVS